MGAAPPLRPLTVTVKNISGVPLECQVLGAHWYAQPPLPLPPGRNVTLTLSVLGDQLRMEAGLPVERVYCGLAGQAWQTRGEFDLKRLTLRPQAGVTCRDAGNSAACNTE